ncbi:MAG: sigma-70 family RNA polymerase sigma factor [Phycisphaerales bacterium]
MVTPGDDRAVEDSLVRDAELIARLRSGEESAFVEMISLYGGRSLMVARRFMRTEQDAEDAVQDAFLSVFKNLDRFDENARLSTWLHRIVVNACLMRLRSQRRRPETSIESLLPTFLPDGHQSRPNRPWPRSAEQAFEQREMRDLVRRKIDELPDGYRDVLLLRDIEGLDTAETASALDMTETAVKTRLHRARQALRELLDPHLREIKEDGPC